MLEAFPIIMFFGIIVILLCGFPVVFILVGSSLIFAFLGFLIGSFDLVFLQAIPERIYGTMANEIFIVIFFFVFMGVMLERSKISEDLLSIMVKLFGGIWGGLGILVCFVGGLLVVAIGIVGATVVMMGLFFFLLMLKKKYFFSLATGIICASGTLGQIIPPSIILVILGDVISVAHQQVQIKMGNFFFSSVSVGDLFVGALILGVLLMVGYIIYIVVIVIIKPGVVLPVSMEDRGNLRDSVF